MVIRLSDRSTNMILVTGVIACFALATLFGWRTWHLPVEANVAANVHRSAAGWALVFMFSWLGIICATMLFSSTVRRN